MTRALTLQGCQVGVVDNDATGSAVVLECSGSELDLDHWRIDLTIPDPVLLALLPSLVEYVQTKAEVAAGSGEAEAVA